MRCFQWCLLLFLITVFRACGCQPLGVRVAALAKQYAALDDDEFDDYELDVGDSNDRVDHLLNADIDDNVYDDNEDVNEDVKEDVNDLSDDVEHDDESFIDNDDGHHNAAFEENNVEDDSADDEIDRITGYRPDVALTSPLEYYN